MIFWTSEAFTSCLNLIESSELVGECLSSLISILIVLHSSWFFFLMVILRWFRRSESAVTWLG